MTRSKETSLLIDLLFPIREGEARSLVEKKSKDKGWSEPILPDTRGSQLPAQSGQRKSTATLADIKPSCSFLAMRLTSASLRGLVLVCLIESKKTAGFCWSLRARLLIYSPLRHRSPQTLLAAYIPNWNATAWYYTPAQ